MRVRTYVLIGAVAMIIMSSGSKNAKPTVGVNPGDLAPRIESFGNEPRFHFQNHSGRYTLLNFWAAYDAPSRVRNIQLSNEMNQSGSDKVVLCSVSLDDRVSIFEETIKSDKLSVENQFRVEPDAKSDLFKQYHLQKGLKNFLIDETGKIVAVNVTPDKLTEFLNQI